MLKSILLAACLVAPAFCAAPSVYTQQLKTVYTQGGVFSPDPTAPSFGSVHAATGSAVVMIEDVNGLVMGLTVSFEVDVCSDFTCGRILSRKSFTADFLPAGSLGQAAANLTLGGTQFTTGPSGVVRMKGEPRVMPVVPGSAQFTYTGPPTLPGHPASLLTATSLSFEFVSYDFGKVPVTMVVQLLP